MADKQLVVVVDGTAAMGPFWQTVRSDYLDIIIKSFCGNELGGLKTTSKTELALVTFNSHGPCCAFLVQRSGWTRDIDIFFQWLSVVSFTGGGFNDAAIAEGLSEALMMLYSPNGGVQTQGIDCQRHCILVSSSNPYQLPTPVYCPRKHVLEHPENSEAEVESHFYDAEGVAKAFGQCSVSLSLISPKQLPKLRAIYNMGKFSPRSADASVDSAKNPQYLVLISENFAEARSIFSRPGPMNMSAVKVDTVSVPTTTVLSSNSVPTGVFNRQPVSVGTIIKSESGTLTTMIPGSSFIHGSAVSRPPPQAVQQSMQTSSLSSSPQDVIPMSENSQDVKPTTNGMLQTLRPAGTMAANVSILNNLSQARQAMNNNSALNGVASAGFQSMHGSPMAVPVQMSNMISNGISSSAVSSINGSASVTGSASLVGSALASQNSALGPFTQSNSNITMSQSLGNHQGGLTMNQLMPGIGQGNLQMPQMFQNRIYMNQSMMNVGSSALSSGNGAIIPTPGIQTHAQPVMQPINGDNNSSTGNLQQPSGAMQPVQSRYVKIWEGCLSGQRQGHPVYITKLEGYRNVTASETIAANWPPVMQILRLISADHMNNKQYAGKADYIVFRALNPHGFLDQLQDKKLCSVIQLPTQTLLLSVSDKATRLIGMLFPEEMVVFKPHASSSGHQQLSQMQQQLQQQQQLLAQMPAQQQQQFLAQLQSQQQQQQQQQQQLVVGGGMGQAYNITGMGRPQMVGGMGQLSSQGPPQPNMNGGGGFMG